MSGTARDDADILLFDLYGTLVDPLAIAGPLERHLPEATSRDVAATWRQKQIEYSFRLTLMQRYRDFAWVTRRALDYALLVHGVSVPADVQAEVLDQYDSPEPFADVVAGLQRLCDSGFTLYVLSNGSPEMLQRCLVNSGLAGYFTAWMSVDSVEAFKPSPQVYQHASDILGRAVSGLRLVSCNPFDVIGGKSAGMCTAWVNRSGGPFDTIGDPPDMEVSDLEELGERLSRER